MKSRLANSCSGAPIHVSALPCVQGVKFYDSVVEGNTPEAVDFRGIQNLSAAVQQHVGTMGGVTVFAADGQVNSVQGPCLGRQPSDSPQAGESGPLNTFVKPWPSLVYRYR